MNQPAPLLSILIPAYNASKFLGRCLDSIVSQDQFSDNVEIVVIDDGSKDRTLEVIKNYSAKCDSVHYKTRENRGIGPTRNELIEMARGRYFWFVDADDYVSADSLQVLAPLLQSNLYDMIMFAFNWKSADGVKTVTCRGEYISGLDMADHDVYNNSLWTRVYRKSVIDDHQVKFNTLQMGEDFDFIFRLIPYLDRCKCLEQPLYNYVVSAGSAITATDMKHKVKSSDDSLTCIESGFQWIRQWDKSQQRILRKPLNFFLMGYLYSIFVVPFSYRYKKQVMNRLSACGAFPIYPLPINKRHRQFSRIMNIKLLRKVAIVLSCILIKKSK
jgi:glycosyltransferase involved in cell wall biosynthesis